MESTLSVATRRHCGSLADPASRNGGARHDGFATLAQVEDAIVIAVEVAPGSGALADEPVTTATLRGVADARKRIVRIVGGPTRGGSFARLAGYVVPVIGARVRFDLHERHDLRPLLAVKQLDDARSQERE